MGRLAAQRLLPGERHHIELAPLKRLGEGGRGGVANGEPGAVSRDPVGIGHTHAYVVPFQVNTMSVAGSALARSGSSP